MATHLIIERYQVYRADGDEAEPDGQKEIIDVFQNEDKWRLVGQRLRFSGRVSIAKADAAAKRQVEIGITSPPPVE